MLVLQEGDTLDDDGGEGERPIKSVGLRFLGSLPIVWLMALERMSPLYVFFGLSDSLSEISGKVRLRIIRALGREDLSGANSFEMPCVL